MSYACRVLRLTLTRVQSLNHKIDINLSAKALSYQLPDHLRLYNARFYSTEVLAEPTPSNMEKQYSQKIMKIAEEITKLTLMEVNDLNSLLMKTLNIKETPMMAYGAMPAAATQASPIDEEEEQVKTVKTSFNVTLTKYAPDKKIALIKEIKNIVEGLNLVQAKKFVEEVPRIVKGDISKEEAESLKKLLEEAGGECNID